MQELDGIVVPFFERYKLRTEKQKDFLIFKKVVRMMKKKEHLTERGRDKILILASSTNRKKKRQH